MFSGLTGADSTIDAVREGIKNAKEIEKALEEDTEPPKKSPGRPRK